MKPALTFTPQMFLAAVSGKKDVTRRVLISPAPRLPVSASPSLPPPPYGPPGTILPMVTSWRVAGYWGTQSGNDEGYQKPRELDAALVKEAGGIYWENVGFVKSDGTLDPQRFSFEGISRPARFLPKSLYHLAPQVEIISTRAEPLHAITVADAIREGMAPDDGLLGTDDLAVNFAAEAMFPKEAFIRPSLPIARYRVLWDTINAKRHEGAYVWHKNPLVWRIEFKLIVS